MGRAKTMIYIVRHGETDWNLKELLMGQTDQPLNATGIKQAIAIARDLRHVHFDSIYASPLIRTQQTAKEINAYHHMRIRHDNDLRERSFGKLEGKNYEEVGQYHAALLFSETWHYPNYRPPSGESANDVLTRVKHFVKQVIGRNKGKSILIVSHGVTIRILIAVLLGNPPEFLHDVRHKNASMTIIEIKNNTEPTLHIVNYLPR